MGLSKHRRLRRREEFRRALRDGKRARDALLSITAVRSELPNADSRYGFAIPKRVGGAVVRNRIKRRLRAIVGKSDHPKGWDYVIYAFPAAANATSEKLAGSVNRLVRRLKPGNRTRSKSTSR
ncbi:MAG: ribonuclease P protein component [Chloroflexi bacterium]|nr:ribonuclease P protein component [Chloroflexota bacterium]MYF78440.1 ribonuclease P protein component [Chloroflexota bacterium]MYK61085.1 ribonuclease P protein component [Chloroflexota bacterium]